MTERVKELENEIEHLHLQAQTDRSVIMNGHIEQAAS
jgi:hypothetical protein